MRFLFSFLLILIFFQANSQIKKVTEYYVSGNIKVKGQTLTFPTNNKILCSTLSLVTKKVGEWKYFYPEGGLMRIEKFSKSKDCNVNGTANGKWEYYSREGKLIKEEIYRDGNLHEGEISEIFKDSILVGKIRMSSGMVDSLLLPPMENCGPGLVKNNDFSAFYGGPPLLSEDGQKQIEFNLPFWFSSNRSTADYYNRFRKLSRVPDNLPLNLRISDDHYAGIILFHNPTLYYSEYITGSLKTDLLKGKKYYIGLKICLSQNSGYYLNRLGICFSADKPAIKNSMEEQPLIPQIQFREIMDNREIWTLLCDSFVAAGNEKYITLGRFSSVSSTEVHSIKPVGSSEGEYNQSAYYLLSQVLVQESLPSDCACRLHNETDSQVSLSRIDFDSVHFNDPINLNRTQLFVLNHILFDFDKSDLLPPSIPELEKLLHFIQNHDSLSLTIMGHTDNVGSDEYNYALSLSRAKAVYSWLLDKGIKPGRLKFEAYGATRPVKENTSPENRQKNRRVEVKTMNQ